jgi:hypothetical protein
MLPQSVGTNLVDVDVNHCSETPNGSFTVTVADRAGDTGQRQM